MRCEDFPCCGHEMGCCPTFDENGQQVDMVCTCGARLPINNPVSICNGCLRMGTDDDPCDYGDCPDGYEDEEDEDEDEDEGCGGDCNNCHCDSQ